MKKVFSDTRQISKNLLGPSCFKLVTSLLIWTVVRVRTLVRVLGISVLALHAPILTNLAALRGGLSASVVSTIRILTHA